MALEAAAVLVSRQPIPERKGSCDGFAGNSSVPAEPLQLIGLRLRRCRMEGSACLGLSVGGVVASGASLTLIVPREIPQVLVSLNPANRLDHLSIRLAAGISGDIPVRLLKLTTGERRVPVTHDVGAI